MGAVSWGERLVKTITVANPRDTVDTEFETQ
jgi:hypothetical protein